MWEAFEEEKGAVLLIDEVDKADIEFPNDLLLELDRMEFFVYETKQTVRARRRPAVIITSNNEKELPDAFLRRCFFHYIRFPDEATMASIVAAHHKDLKKGLVNEALSIFYGLREIPGLKKKPTTSELLDWIRLLVHEGVDPDHRPGGDRRDAAPRLELLVELGRRPRNGGAGDVQAAQLLGDGRDLARRDALDVHLGQRQLQGAFGPLAAFERLRVEAGAVLDVADLRHRESQRTHAALDGLVLVAVGVATALLGALVPAGVQKGVAFEFHRFVEQDLDRGRESVEAGLRDVFQHVLEGCRILLAGHRFRLLGCDEPKGKRIEPATSRFGRREAAPAGAASRTRSDRNYRKNVTPLIGDRRSGKCDSLPRRNVRIQFAVPSWMLKAKVVLPDGMRVPTEEGTPQGGPLSPILSNVVLDELDRDSTGT